MLLQTGRFIVKNIQELERVVPNQNGIKRIFDLDYMGRYEYEGNTIPASRMLIEYNRDKYMYLPVDFYNKNGEQMYIYMFTDGIQVTDKDLLQLAHKNIEENYTLYEHINEPNKRYGNDFWWSIEYNYIIFFGIEKIKLIEHYIDSCYKRDGGKEEIGKKLGKLKLYTKDNWQKKRIIILYF